MFIISTLKEIAKAAGVSVMTVSNVVNGNHARVSEATISKINLLIKEMNYTPNEHARVLSTNKSTLIALCIIGHSKDNLLEDPYNSYIVGAISRHAEESGYAVLLNSENNIKKVTSNLKSWNLAGAIFLGVSEKEISIINEAISIPFVCLDSYFSSDKIITVGTDDYQGGWLAGNYLAGLGHKRIAYASGTTILDENSKSLNPLLYYRFKGFKDALDSNDLYLDYSNVFSGEISYEQGVEMGLKLSKSKEITAVFCTADILAIGIIEGLRLNGVRVPHQISVLGFDNLNIGEYVNPKLSTIHQQNSLKGKTAVELLIKLINKPDSITSSIKYDVKVIERQTTISLNY